MIIDECSILPHFQFDVVLIVKWMKNILVLANLKYNSTKKAYNFFVYALWVVYYLQLQM